MAYPAIKLINKAFYLSGIVSQDFNQATLSQLNEGLDSLNDILAEKSVDNSLNPYYQPFDLTVVPGQEEYFIENLIDASTVTFTLDTVRYSVMKTARNRYMGSARANGIQSLPFLWHIERCFGGSNLFMYYLPNQAYEFQIWGQFALSQDITLYQDLSLLFDRFYLNYLKFALAVRLCQDFSITVPQSVNEKLSELDLIMQKQMGTMDLSVTKVSTLMGGSSLNYGFVNLSPNGWTPSGSY